jgi:1-deoxy-D-xylulose-5-phosphate synthase
LQRAYDQIIHDVCLQNLPVIFAIDRAGIVGEDGATHNGVFDLSYLRIIPNLVIMSPKDETELAQMLRVALTLNKPCAIRYPRGSGYGIKTTENSSILDIGKAEMIFEKGDITVIAIGSTVYPSKFAIEKLQQENINLKLVNLRFLKPIDEDLIRNLAHNSKAIITVEENVLAGGMGSYVREILSDENIKIFSIGLPDEFIEHGPQNKIRDIYNLSEEKLSVIFRQISSNYN